MAELSLKERLQPSLLDRLTDDEPRQQKESREKRVLSIQRLRESVRRDLAWLFNCVNLSAAQDLSDYPEVEHSVLNFGLPDLSGHTASSVDVVELEHLLRQCVRDFEPRIMPGSVKVRLIVDEQRMSHNAMVFDIEGELWARPLPLHLYLRTEVDLEMGDVKVSDYGTSGGR
jgi:type VI secretion system protein ImpF